MRNTERVKWGILSTSSTALSMAIPALKKCTNTEVVAIASRDPEKAARIAKDMAIPHALGSYDDLIKSKRIDAVYIPLPNSIHREWVVRAAQAGKSVLCEKPAALTVADALEIETACSVCNVAFMEGFHYRFHPQFGTVRQWLAQDLIGPVRLVRAGFSFRLEERHSRIRLSKDLAGGAIADVGSDCVDLCQWLTQRFATKVVTWGDFGLGAEVETSFAALVDFPGGVRACLDGSFEQARHSRCEIIGERGVIGIGSPFLPAQGSSVSLHAGSASEQVAFPAVDTFQLQFEHFSKCLIEGRPPLISMEDSIGNAQTLEALRASLNQGSAVNLQFSRI